MELGLIIYWSTFYSALAGWLARTVPIVKNNQSIDFNRYIFPRVLLAHVISAYFLVLIFYLFSLLVSNKGVLLFLSAVTLAATEYFWIRLGVLRKKITESLIIKIVFIALGVAVVFYFSSVAGTYLERLTKVSPGVFGPFQNLLTFALSSGAWIVLAQLFLTVLSVTFMVKLFIKKDDHIENLLFILVSGIASSFLLVIATKLIFSNAIPYLVENHFVPHAYHSNKGLDGAVICKNRAPEEQIVLLPTGGISIATLNSEKEWVFAVDACERKVNNASQSDG